jgi:hypothetical protein
MPDEQGPNASGDGSQDSGGSADTSQTSAESGVQMGTVDVLDPEVLRRAAQHF